MSVCVYVFLCACISVYGRVNVGLRWPDYG
jgi:hypothetical protein